MESQKFFERAKKVIPGGVNSPVRAFNSVGGDPVYMVRGHGSHLTTADGQDLVDYCGSWGPLVLGHAHPKVVEAIRVAAGEGTSFGTNTPREVEFAELLCECISYVEKIRLVSSGTEAVMTALRLARGFTGRNKIIKFDGGYHGHSDSLLVSAGSGILTAGESFSDGVPPGVTADILVSPYNDLDAVKAIVAEHGKDLAAIILEPVAGNMGLVPPLPGFLKGLRDITALAGSLLIFDEVISGFRLGATTYGQMCGITPDLTTLGKIIGGGLPIGAVGGRQDIMACLAPLGKVYQAGTLSGNPVAVAAGLATIKTLIEDDPYPRLEQLGKTLSEGVNTLTGGTMHVAQLGGMFTPFFCADPVHNLDEAKTCDTQKYAAFFHHMLNQGIYLPPSQFEVGFISAAHIQDDVEAFIEAAGAFLR